MNSTLDETLGSSESQSTALVFNNRQIKRSLDGFGLGFSSQSFLSALDFRGIKLKMFVRPLPCLRRETSLSRIPPNIYLWIKSDAPIWPLQRCYN
jgi:hypothetical protein